MHMLQKHKKEMIFKFVNGNEEEIRRLIIQNKNLVLTVESKIASFMKIDINRAIEGIKAN
jgi:hypothetical protein